MKEEHKNKIAEMLMNDYDIRPSLAQLIVKVFVESAEQIIKEDEVSEKLELWRRKHDCKANNNE